MPTKYRGTFTHNREMLEKFKHFTVKVKSRVLQTSPKELVPERDSRNDLLYVLP